MPTATPHRWQAQLERASVVDLSDGQFTIAATVQMPSGGVLRGAGTANMDPTTGTRIVAVSGLNADLINLSNADVPHVEIRDLVLVGGKDNQSGTSRGIYLDRTGTTLTTAPRDLISNVLVYQSLNAGVHIVQPGSSGGGAADLINVRVRDAGGNGFTIGGFDVFATQCIALGCDDSGFQVITNGEGAQLVNCKGDANQERGLYGSGAPNCKVIGWQSLINNLSGIEIAQDGWLVTGAHLYNNGTAGTPRAALALTAAVQGFVGTGLFCLADEAVMSYGVTIGDGADNILLQGGSMGHQTGSLLDNSAGGNGTKIYKTQFVDLDTAVA